MIKKKELSNYEKIVKELFFGKSSALDKYAKVRFTYYELSLWRRYGVPLKEIDRSAKKYFSVRFLGGKDINEASENELQDALNNLRHAVENGCKGRCTRLVQSLNDELSKNGLATVEHIDEFLDYLTFYYTTVKGYDGRPRTDSDYHYEIRIFHNEENLKGFKDVLGLILKQHRIISMQDVFRLVRHIEKNSKKL